MNNYLPKRSEIFYVNIERPDEKLTNSVYFNKLNDFLKSKFSTKDASTYATSKEPDKKNLLQKYFEQTFRFIDVSDTEDSPLVQYENCLHKEFHISESEDNISHNNMSSSCPIRDINLYQLPSLGRLFDYLFSDVWKKYEKIYRPQHIHRHKLTSILFFDPELRKNPPQKMDILKHHTSQQEKLRDTFETKYDSNINENKGLQYNYAYFLDRTIVEIAIAFLRGHGAVDYFELRHGRVNHYYKLYAQNFDKNKGEEKGKRIALAELVLKFIESQDINIGPPYQIISNIIEINNLNIESNCKFLNENFPSLFTEVQQEFKKLISNEKPYCRYHGDEEINLYRRKLTQTIIMRLLSHSNISKEFRQRINATTKWEGFELLKYDKTQYKYQPLTHLQMIVNSANRLVGANFYSISTQHINSDHYTWQSYSLSKQIHTNLQLDYGLKRAIEDKESYNIIFSVSEVGGNIRPFLHEDAEENGSIASRKKIIQICSYEAVKQLHKSEEKIDKSQLIIEHKKYILGIKAASFTQFTDSEKEAFNRFELFLIPYTLHNHHMTLFSKLEDKVLAHKIAVYIWRRGFSTQMNPIIFERSNDDYNNQLVENDLNALFTIFIKYLDRGFLFNKINKIISAQGGLLNQVLHNDDKPVDSMDSLNTYDLKNLEKIKDNLLIYLEGQILK